MLVVECKGRPYEIGHQHGTAAIVHVARSIAFYAAIFQKNCKMSWPEVQDTASSFEQHIKQTWPGYHEEMKGIADGADVDILDVVALNVRTEINFGKFSDGCTALAWHTEKRAYLAQNWDWMEEQKENLIITKISQPGKPTIQQITEAGIIGKIGFNSNGVGTCLNAIKVKGVNATNLPVHLGLRLALESGSVAEAVQKLESYGMASSAHILLADPTTAIGLEFSASTFAHILQDEQRRVIHANHLLVEHPGVVDTVWLMDSLDRVKRMSELSVKVGGDKHQPSWEEFSRLFEDENGYPKSICRAQEEDAGSGTLFNIVMDLKSKTAVVRMGRPCKAEETVTLSL